jgi:hypothetical protein
VRALVVFLLGAGVALAGDACHVASGTTGYDVDGIPTIWRSALWFPFAVGLAVLLAAWAASRSPLAATRTRTPIDVGIGAAAVLALYALTAALRGQDSTVSVVLTAAIAVGIALWWDPSARALTTAAAAAVLGPLSEIGVAHAGWAHYAADSDGLWGVAPWLPCLYFASGAVASGVWDALDAKVRSPWSKAEPQAKTPLTLP